MQLMRVHRSEHGPPGSPVGLLLGRDDRGRSVYAVIPWSEAVRVEVLRFLEKHDPERPERPSGRHSSAGGWWIVTVPGLGGPEVYQGAGRLQADRIHRQMGGTFEGSEFG